MNKTEQFLNELDLLFQKNFPTSVIEKSKISLLDYIAVTLAGTTFFDEKQNRYLEFERNIDGNTNVIGLHQKLNLKEAVFLNGLNGHALDFDDGTNTGIIHLGSPIFSVLLPLAQKYKIDTKTFLKAVIIGYETSFTMAVSIQPKHKELGYHATGTCGILGIALAASYMLGFSKEKRKNAFAIACASATGMLNVLDDGSELKPYNVAKTALLGLTAVQMAYAGYKGHPDPLGSSRGFLKMMTGDKAIELKNPLLNGTYAIEKTYTKPYAACRYCHPAIEAAIKLKEKNILDKTNISSVNVRTYYWAVNKHDHTNIPSSASAKMSTPYGIAVGLLYGKAGLKEYDSEYIQNEQILELAKKVIVESDDNLTAQFPKKTTAIVTICTNDGTKYVEQVDFPKGEPENPFTEGEFKARFIELVLYGKKTQAEAVTIYDFVKNMDGDMSGLFEKL